MKVTRPARETEGRGEGKEGMCMKEEKRNIIINMRRT